MKHIIDKVLSRVRPFRIFEPAAELLDKAGFIERATLDKLVEYLDEDTLKAEVNKFVVLNKTPVAAPDLSALRYAVKCAFNDLFPNDTAPKLVVQLDIDVLMQNINLQANFGLPFFKKKGMLLDVFRQTFSMILSGFDLNVFESYARLSAIIFTRCQIKSTEKISTRLVFAVSGYISALESIWVIPLIEHFKSRRDSSYMIGLRQKEISELAISSSPFHKTCIDFSSYDLTVPTCVNSIGFEIVERVFVRDSLQVSWTDRLLELVKNHFISGNSYHPFCGTVARKRGLPSGSSFTNIIGSISNLILLRYGLIKSDQNKYIHKIIVHGDDSVIYSRVKLDTRSIVRALNSIGMIVKPEKIKLFGKGEPTFEFLGSTWKNGLPERDIAEMSAKAAVVTGKPIILSSIDQYLESRIYSIFGFDHRLSQIWKDLGLGVLDGKRIFLLQEGMAWDQALEYKAKHIEGVWITATGDSWMTR